MKLSRRGVLKIGVCLTGGLLVEFCLGGATQAQTKTVRFDAFLSIGVDGEVTLTVPSTEIGQGIHTAYALLVAGELDVDPAGIQVRMAPCAQEYFNPWAGEMFTGDSSSVRGFLTPLCTAGAVARTVLVQAAAARWQVNPEQCSTSGGLVHFGKNSLAYGALAQEAAALPSPGKVKLRPVASASLRGGDRRHAVDRVRGEAVFGMDIRLEGMVFATPLHCPMPGGRLRSVDASQVEQMPGVLKVISGVDRVVTVAKSSYGALSAMRALHPMWDPPAGGLLDQAGLEARLATALQKSPGMLAVRLGKEKPPKVTREVSLEFWAPLLAHAAMEPVVATVRIQPGRVEVWAPTQVQSQARRAVSAALKVPESTVQIHTTLAGGSFGRKLEVDYIVEAAEAARDTGRPVQLFWSREQDMRHDFFRPPALARVTIGLDEAGTPIAWTQHSACPSIGDRTDPEKYVGKLDPFAVEGALEMPYTLERYELFWHRAEIGLPVGHMRSVGHAANAWFREHAFDAAVAGSGLDPLDLRLQLLPGSPRMVQVLTQVRDMAKGPAAEGRFRGVAVHVCYGTAVAHMVEVSLDGGPRIHRIWCALDCGRAVDTDTVRAQAEGASLFALSAALHEQVTVSEKGPVPSNFDTYRILKLAETPPIEVHIVDSQAPAGGVGEACVPTLAPALCNAILAATSQPVPRLPLTLHR